MLDKDLNKIIKRILREEYYDRKKLYPVEYVYIVTQRAPSYIREMVRDLIPIACENEKGVRSSCFRIPESLYLWIHGRRD